MQCWKWGILHRRSSADVQNVLQYCVQLCCGLAISDIAYHAHRTVGAGVGASVDAGAGAGGGACAGIGAGLLRCGGKLAGL